jgi:hypothetical protein
MPLLLLLLEGGCPVVLLREGMSHGWHCWHNP